MARKYQRKGKGMRTADSGRITTLAAREATFLTWDYTVMTLNRKGIVFCSEDVNRLVLYFGTAIFCLLLCIPPSKYTLI